MGQATQKLAGDINHLISLRKKKRERRKSMGKNK